MTDTQKLNVDAIREWIRSTLSQCNLTSPDGRWLFAYDLSKSDFERLEQLIKTSCLETGGFSQLVSRKNAFSAMFVFYAAEWWKHNYAGGAWDWGPIVESLGGDDYSFPQQLRSECVTLGLRYWGHTPLSHGKRFIGAIAAHGGIPMKLLSQGVGRLAVILGLVLKQAGRYNWSLIQIQDAIEQYQYQLPAAYRRPEISDLLARFVDTVLQLKSEFQLADRIDPIAYLDAEVPDWRRRFPISLEVEAAQTLLIGLVREASTQRANNSGDLFRCEHRLVMTQASNEYSIESVLTHSTKADAEMLAQYFGLKGADLLPRYISVDIETEMRQPFVEGRLVLGASEPVVNLTGRKISLAGLSSLSEHCLILRAGTQDIGERVTVSGGGVVSLDDPWVFMVGDDDVIRFIASGSARVQTSSAVIALPSGWTVRAEGGLETKSLGVLTLGSISRQVVHIDCDCTVASGALEYRVRLSQSATDFDLYQWKGARLPEARGKQVFKDKVPPILYRADEEALVKVQQSDQRWVLPGTSISTATKEARGPVDVLISSDGELVGRQRIYVLPAAASIRYLSGESVGQGTISFVNWGPVDVSIDAENGITCHYERAVGGHEVTVALLTTQEPPTEVKARIKWPGCSVELLLRLPFPVTGGRFYRNSSGALPNGGRVSVRELIGLRLQVFDTNPSNPKAYALQVGIGAGSKEISYKYPIELDTSGRADVRLIDYQKTIESLLGLIDDLDATVRVTLIVGNARSTEINIARFMGVLEPGENSVKLSDDCLTAIDATAFSDIKIFASPLDNLARESIEVFPAKVEGVAIGTWDMEPLNKTSGSWLVYPASDSSVDFRPLIWQHSVPNFIDIPDPVPVEGSGCPLIEAMAIADRNDRWVALKSVLSAMCLDFGHPSWGSMHRLWNTFQHLPLPALDIWKMLGRHSKGLLAFAFTSPMPEHELARAIHRFRDETGWTPEMITMKNWHRVVFALWEYWKTQLPEDLAKTVFLAQLEGRLTAFKNEFASLELLIDFVSFEVSNVPPPSLMSIGAQTNAKVDQLLKQLWVGGESLVNVQLFTVNAMRDNWPGKGFFEEAFSALLEALDDGHKKLLSPFFSKFFWLQPGDFKLSVANTPMLCAIWAATSTDQQWWGEPKNRMTLRRIRDFDPIWFEQCFRHGFSVLLAMQGMIKPQRFVELPA